MVIQVFVGGNWCKMIGLEGQLCLTWSNYRHSMFFFHPRMNWLENLIMMQLVCLFLIIFIWKWSSWINPLDIMDKFWTCERNYVFIIFFKSFPEHYLEKLSYNFSKKKFQAKWMNKINQMNYLKKWKILHCHTFIYHAAIVS
jgi:hypothetical protein